MMTDSTILACHQRATGSKTVETRVSTVILNVYHTGIEKYWDRKGGWFQTISGEPQKARRDTEILQQEVRGGTRRTP